MKKPSNKLTKWAKALAVVAVILLPSLYLTYQVMHTASIECEVCMEFRGNSKCRRASGQDQDTCKTTATDNACAFLASGMTDSIACAQREPQKIEFY